MANVLILNADDFGFSASVNSAVLRARKEGLLTSASLMVRGAAASEAVRIARDDPTLAVGLHVVVTQTSATPVCQPDASPIMPAFRLFFEGSVRRRVVSAIESQFAAFADTGLLMSHVDGHQHLHAHPSVLPTVIRQALACGARGIRVPKDFLTAGLCWSRSAAVFKIFAALGSAFLARICSDAVAQSGLARCDYSVGSISSGHMTTDFACRILSRLDCESLELFFHPSTEVREVEFGPNRGDLETLLSPALKSIVMSTGWKPGTYADLAKHLRRS